MHILIIPSEPFIPKDNELSGIFQYDQARIFEENGYKVGILSVSVSIPFVILIKNILKKICFLNTNTENLPKSSFFELFLKLFENLLQFKPKYTIENIGGLTIYRVLYFPFNYSGYKSREKWVTIGKYVFDNYLKKEGKPNLIHAHNALNAGLLAKKIKADNKIPFVLTEHDSKIIIENLSEQKSASVKEVYLDSNSNIAVSPFLGEQMKKKFLLNENLFQWIPNVIGSEFEEFNLPLLKHSKDPFVFLSVGNLIELKNHELLIRAFARSFKGEEGYLLKIAGDGDLRSFLFDLTIGLGIANQVIFLGEIKRGDVLKEMFNCSVFVHSSNFETFGLVLIEALALGKPVISTSCGGPNCIVNDSNGILVQVNNLDELSFAMKNAKNSFDEINPESIRADCLKRFGKKPFLAELKKVYASLID